jgi:hypothetical protein
MARPNVLRGALVLGAIVFVLVLVIVLSQPDGSWWAAVGAGLLAGSFVGLGYYTFTRLKRSGEADR